MPKKSSKQSDLFSKSEPSLLTDASDTLVQLQRPLTKEDLDKVRDVEGFPTGTDQDIIALSDSPYYTACPNPFLDKFIREYGSHYDEAQDTYNRTPFASDVSEGKNDPIYLAHTYHTKVPYKAIIRYILHYTKPGDIVFDGFCGTGMTGVAALMCGRPDADFKAQTESDMREIKWGARHAVLCDLSPAATFIAYNFNTPKDADHFERESTAALTQVEEECQWMFQTRHSDKSSVGRINYTIWSDVFTCPICSEEVIFWNDAVDKSTYQVQDHFHCSHCRSDISKESLERVFITRRDVELGINVRQAKQIPVLIHYFVGNTRHLKQPDESDLELLERIENSPIPYRVPTNPVPKGDKTSDPFNVGITHVHQFYTRRNLWALAAYAARLGSTRDYVDLTSVATVITKMYRFRSQNQSLGAGGGPLALTLYIPSLSKEIPVTKALREHIVKTTAVKRLIGRVATNAIGTQSHTDLNIIPNNSVDYIFTDPPFGSNIMYSELNIVWEAWLKVFTQNTFEAVINRSQHKDLGSYEQLMARSFREAYRILKPGRWITVEFHNSQNRVWNAIQEALQLAGFVIADVRIFDKQQGSFNQATASGAVKHDLIITAYKTRSTFEERFVREAGTEHGVWDFIDQHLKQLPVFVEKQGALEIIAERQNFLLFDRMVAFYVQRGISVPLGASEFYASLRRRYAERDSMYFLFGQVAGYDTKRATIAQIEQLSLFVSDEKSAVQWLRLQLEGVPQTYQDLQPQFLQELHQARHEQLPELSRLLEENFLKDSKDRWYVPDPGKSEDLEKLRERGLLREFETYRLSKGKLKTFRTEAIRAGFKAAWARRDYTTIVEIARRLPEDVLQEDPALLMYYDNSAMRSGTS